MPTRDELEAWAVEDYEQVVGKTIWVAEFSAYVNDVSVDFNLEQPLKVKVQKTPRMDLFHWVDEWLDPYWEIEILEIPEAMYELHPKLREARAPWMFGDSYSLDGKMSPGRYAPRYSPRDWSPRERQRKGT